MECLAATVTGGGKSICMARIQKGMSMRSLAEKAGMSVSAVSKIERGAVKAIRPLSAQKICTALDVPFESLFAIVGPDSNHRGS